MAAPRAEVVAAADVVVSDQPALAQIQAVVPAPAGLGGPAGRDASAALADLLDVPEIRADDLTHDVHVEGGSEQRPAGLPAWTLARRVVVDGRDVRWWVDPQGRVSAIDVVSAAQGLAAALGTWHDRLRIEVMLSAPERIVDIAHDDLWG